MLLTQAHSQSNPRRKGKLLAVPMLLLFLQGCSTISDAPGHFQADTRSPNHVARLTAQALHQFGLGNLNQADALLKEAEILADKSGDDAALAMVLNNQAMVAAQRSQWPEATGLYQRSAETARAQGLAALEFSALADAASALSNTAALNQAAGLMDQAATVLGSMSSEAKSKGVLRLATTAVAIMKQHPARQPDMLARLRVYADLAEHGSEKRPHDLQWVHALMLRSQLEKWQQRPDEAIRLAEQALFINQQLPFGESPTAAWALLTHLGELYQNEGNELAALSAYERATARLELLRPALLQQDFERSFAGGEAPAQVYRQMLQLLFKQAELHVADSRLRDEWLIKARDKAEQMKVAEVRNYFRDDCVEELESKVRGVETVSRSAAVVYPVILEENLELLLEHPQRGLLHFHVAVTRSELLSRLREYRKSLEANLDFREPASVLYQWLVGPYASWLGESIHTLVFVPGGELAAVPMATLISPSGRYVIEDYAVAVTPGMQLSDPKPLDRKRIRPLYAGLSEPQPGFSALMAVRDEVFGAAALFPGDVLLDQDFSIETLSRRLQDDRLNILHLATHGQFGDSVEESFILTWDGRLNMDQLASAIGHFKYRDQPLELLVLSACETANSSARAALGLSGIAIKASARSAIGTLWKVDDQASALLMKTFYRILKEQPELSRAEVLQQSQLYLYQQTAYANPGYWAPYILINSWL